MYICNTNGIICANSDFKNDYLFWKGMMYFEETFFVYDYNILCCYGK